MRIKFAAVVFALMVLVVELWAMEAPSGYVPGLSPSAPTALKASWVYTSDGAYEIHLSWNENPESNVIGYIVYRSFAGSHFYQRLNHLDGIDNDFDGEVDETDNYELVAATWYEDENVDFNLDHDRTYYYRVTAVVGGYFESYWSEPVDSGELEVSSMLGCFIATAAYGGVFAPEVQSLREFRDRFLVNNPLGKLFIRMYYRTSPPVARILEKHPVLRYIVRKHLSVIVCLCRWIM